MDENIIELNKSTLLKIKKTGVLFLLTCLIFVELFLGGGGRVLEIYIISFREILFVLAIFLWLIYKFANNFNIKKSSFALPIIILLSYNFVSSFVGVLKGSQYSLIIDDLTPILFFIYFFMLVDILISEKRIKTIIKLMIFCSLLLSLVGISIYLVGNIAPQFREGIYSFINDVFGHDFRFQKNFEVFHKGYIFVLISSLILFTELIHTRKLFNFKKLILFSVLITALILSLTRGFWIAFLVSAIFIFLLLKINKKIKFSAIFFFGVIIVLIVLSTFPNNIFSDVGNRIGQIGSDISSQGRIYIISNTFNIFSQNPIFGSGYGILLPGETISHLEISYLDILMKQGIVGFMIWSYLIFLIFLYWVKLRRKMPQERVFLDGLMAGFIGLLITTATNPFINNPLGIGYLLIVIVSFEYFERQLRMIKVKAPSISYLGKE